MSCSLPFPYFFSRKFISCFFPSLTGFLGSFFHPPLSGGPSFFYFQVPPALRFPPFINLFFRMFFSCMFLLFSPPAVQPSFIKHVVNFLPFLLPPLVCQSSLFLFNSFCLLPVPFFEIRLSLNPGATTLLTKDVFFLLQIPLAPCLPEIFDSLSFPMFSPPLSLFPSLALSSPSGLFYRPQEEKKYQISISFPISFDRLTALPISSCMGPFSPGSFFFFFFFGFRPSCKECFARSVVFHAPFKTLLSPLLGQPNFPPCPRGPSPLFPAPLFFGLSIGASFWAHPPLAS